MILRREFLLGSAAVASRLIAQERDYDERKVRHYTLPAVLTLQNGQPVRDAAVWQHSRRPELLRLFETNEYGRTPRAAAVQVHHELTSRDDNALGGTAVRKLVTLRVSGRKQRRNVDVLFYLPKTKNRKSRAPVFVGVNFRGNHTISSDPAIPLAKTWVFNNPERGIKDHHTTEAARGMQASQWPVEQIVARGYGLATIYSGDLWPDYDGGLDAGIAPLFFDAGQTQRRPDDWGAIGTWAWGLSRVLDYLQTDQDVDHRRVIAIGHSRMGKTALWAGAQDPRFAMVVSNCSGAGGATIARRRFGESVREIGEKFPFWFCENYRKFADREDDLPIDQHELLALSAPRPLYVAVADQDLGSDPRGQWLSAVAASPVYRLLGTDGLAATEMPGVHQPIKSRIGFHMRSGRHDITAYDWDRYMDFADQQLAV